MFAIYNNNGVAENKGGPAGYLFNLQCGLRENNYVIEILSDFNQAGIKNSKTKLKKVKIQLFEEIRSILHFYKKGLTIKYKSKNNFNNYAVLHIHSSEDAYYIKKLIGFRNKIILSSHKPETLANEKIGAINLECGRNWKCLLLRSFYDYIEKTVYSFSDGFVFPSEGAEKLYESFTGYKKNKIGKPVKYVYTGCKKKTITINRMNYRKNLGISNDEFMISYIGRHNYIKGYDLLTKIGDQLINDGMSVVCAGQTSSITYPISKKWIELGYISDAQNLINASDVVIIPNRNTYFDLVIIEILSMGKIVITSHTGGNVDIAKETRGLVLFETGNERSLLQAIQKVREMSIKTRATLQSENIKFYEKHCSPLEFSRNYINAINEILVEMNEAEIKQRF